MTPQEQSQKRRDLRRRDLRDRLPELAIRIFALKGHTYEGCGYHYGFQARIGGLLHRANDLDGIMGEYTEAKLDIDVCAYWELLGEVEKAEAEVAYEAMFQAWFTAEVRSRIDSGKRNFRLAPPKGAEIWEHHKEDRFYRILRDRLSPFGFVAAAAKPLKKEPRHVTLIMAKES